MRYIINAENASQSHRNDQETANRPARKVLHAKHDIIDADELQARTAQKAAYTRRLALARQSPIIEAFEEVY